MKATDYYFRCEADVERWVCMRSTSKDKARRAVLACLFSDRFGVALPLKEQYPDLEQRMSVLEERFGMFVHDTTKELYELNYTPETEDDEQDI
jgi:hypothetical protein